MLLEVDVDGVLPVVARVLDDPVLRGVLRHGEAQLVAARELVVDDPLAVVAVELEVARDARRDDRGQLVEGRMSRGVDAVVGRRRADAELDAGDALAG